MVAVTVLWGLFWGKKIQDDAPLQLGRHRLNVGRSEFSGWIRAEGLNILKVLGCVQAILPSSLYILCICIYLYIYIPIFEYIFLPFNLVEIMLFVIILPIIYKHHVINISQFS